MADETANKETFIQFYASVNTPKCQYREYRVRADSLADIPAEQCTSKSFTDGIRTVVEEHNQAISDLRKQIRQHEEMNTKWQQLKNLPDGCIKDVVNKLLQSCPDGIRQFEMDNFRSNHDWTITKKATNGVNLKSILSSFNEVDEDGNPLSRQEEVVTKSEKVTSPPAEKSIIGKDSTIALEPVPKIDGVETETSKPAEDGRNDDATKVGVEKRDQPREDTNESVNVKLDQKPGNENKSVDAVSPVIMQKNTSEKHGNLVESSSKDTLHATPDRPVLNSTTPSTEEDTVSSLESENGTPPVSKNFELCEELMKHWSDPSTSEVVDTNTVAEKKKAKIITQKIEDLTSLIAPKFFKEIQEIDKFRETVKRNAISRYQMADIQEQDEECEDQPNPLHQVGSSGNSNNKTEDSAEEDEEIAGVHENGDSDNSQSEKSFHTAKTSASPDSEKHEKLDDSVDIANTNCPGTSSIKKKKGKRTKKTKKSNKGPKITQEEIEAIKKQKKAETDREFARLENERANHLRKVENSDKSKLFRQSVQTAIAMLKSSDPLPAEILSIEKGLLDFSKEKTLDDRILLRQIYFENRPTELAKDLMGTELSLKLELLEVYQHEIERAQRLCQYFMFLTILDEKSYDYSDFEFAILRFFFIGREEVMNPNVQEVYRRFDHFVKDLSPSITEHDQFVNAVIYVREKLMLFSDMASRYNITRSEVILREGYCGIAQTLQNLKAVTDVFAFLEHSKKAKSYNLTEAWLLETKCPSAYPCNAKKNEEKENKKGKKLAKFFMFNGKEEDWKTPVQAEMLPLDSTQDSEEEHESPLGSSYEFSGDEKLTGVQLLPSPPTNLVQRLRAQARRSRRGIESPQDYYNYSDEEDSLFNIQSLCHDPVTLMSYQSGVPLNIQDSRILHVNQDRLGYKKSHTTYAHSSASPYSRRLSSSSSDSGTASEQTTTYYSELVKR